MIQSFSDIITNSSSEVFIISTDKHAEVAQFLKDVCELFGYNMGEIMEFESATKDGKIDGWNVKYKKGNLIISSASDNSIPYIITDIIENLSWDWSPVISKLNIRDVHREHLG